MRSSAVTCLSICLLALPIEAQIDEQSGIPDPTVTSVFDDLVRVAGDGRAAPALHLVPVAEGISRIAWFDPAPGKRAIYIEQTTVNVCHGAALGARARDCLAFILGHELAHFYKDHARLLEFARAASVGENGAAAEQDREAVEAQADESGVYYAFLAGYDAFSVSPLVLDALYRETKLPSDIPGYPSLAARKKGLETAKVRLGRVFPVFNAGTALFLAGRYLLAARCFDHAGREFPSREVLNNSGAMRLLEALRLRGSKEHFAFPVEVDFETRLSQLAGRAPAGEEVARLATEALREFDQSIIKDASYLPALTGRALAWILLQRWTEALGAADYSRKSAEDAADAASAARAAIAHGIAAHYSGDDAGARRDFESARTSAAEMARQNLVALGAEKPEPISKCDNAPGKRERIANKLPEDLRALVAPKNVIEVEENDSSFGPLHIFTQEAPEYTGYVIESAERVISVLTTRPDFGGCSERGACLGDNYGAVAARYSCGSVAGSYAGSRYLLFPLQGAVFDFTANGRLKRWMLVSDEPL